MATFDIHHGDALDVLRGMADNSVDAVVTDPPAGIAFMGKDWDKDKGGRTAWIGWMTQIAAECLRVLKPGAHALVWAIPRTSHWTATAWEDAGFEVRDRIAHIFGSGFPKSLNLKDAMPGWGTALKPAVEDWWLLRKPLSESNIAANVLRWGTGAVNVDGCRIKTSDNLSGGTYGGVFSASRNPDGTLCKAIGSGDKGRFPANLIHDGSAEVVGMFPVTTSGAMKREVGGYGSGSMFINGRSGPSNQHGDTGSAARFFKTCPPDDAASLFYCAKASRSERDAGLDETNARNHHPTVKPQSLMRYLCRLITPPSGVILDPFFGSGSTGAAAIAEGFSIIGIEQDAEFVEIARRRCEYAKEVKPSREQWQVSLLEICAENAA